MKSAKVHTVFNVLIAAIWLVNGLYCKVLNFVPRHQEIVGEILGTQYMRPLVIAIGLGEIAVGVAVLLKFKPKFLTIFQIVLVLVMNLIEFFAVPEMLLWGKLNLLFAFVFSAIIYFNFFFLRPNKS